MDENGLGAGAGVAYDGPWLSKTESAAYLGVHPRQIERREAAGYIRKKVLPREPGQSTARVVYSAADLAAIKAGAPNDYRGGNGQNDQFSSKGEEIAKIPPGTAGPGTRAALAPPPFDAQILVAALSKLIPAPPPAPPAEPKPWLTLAEAAEYSGLPERWLLAHAKQGYVGAIDLGGKPRGGRWRFRRDDLARLGA